MENRVLLDAVQEGEPQPTPKKPYEPPTATLVPLKLEERLFGTCVQTVGQSCVPAFD